MAGKKKLPTWIRIMAQEGWMLVIQSDQHRSLNIYINNNEKKKKERKKEDDPF